LKRSNKAHEIVSKEKLISTTGANELFFSVLSPFIFKVIVTKVKTKLFFCEQKEITL